MLTSLSCGSMMWLNCACTVWVFGQLGVGMMAVEYYGVADSSVGRCRADECL